MTNPDFSLSDFLPQQIARSAAHVNRAFSQFLSEHFSISVAEWRIMANLAQSEALSVRDIQAYVDMDKPKISRAADRLEKNGLVKKSVNAQDKRLIELSLTQKGQQMFAHIAPQAHDFEQNLLEKIGPTNKKLLASLLERLTEDPS